MIAITIILLLSFCIALKAIQLCRKFNLLERNKYTKISSKKLNQDKVYFNGKLYTINQTKKVVKMFKILCNFSGNIINVSSINNIEIFEFKGLIFSELESYVLTRNRFKKNGKTNIYLQSGNYLVAVAKDKKELEKGNKKDMLKYIEYVIKKYEDEKPVFEF